MRNWGLIAVAAGLLALTGTIGEAGQKASQLVKIRVWIGPGVSLAQAGPEEPEVSRITTAGNAETWARTLVRNGGAASGFALLGRNSGAAVWGMVQGGEEGPVVRLLTVDWDPSADGDRFTRFAAKGRGHRL